GPKRTSNIYGAIDAPGGKLLPDARWPANVIHDGSDEVVAAFPETDTVGHFPKDRGALGTNGIYGKDGGSAARFFYTTKADADDRLGSKHPTVKPVDLMQWLCRLVTPPGGTILDPFAGTGTTGEAAFREGFNAVLIERDDPYVADIRERVAHYEGQGRHSAAAKNRNVATD